MSDVDNVLKSLKGKNKAVTGAPKSEMGYARLPVGASSPARKKHDKKHDTDAKRPLQ